MYYSFLNSPDRWRVVAWQDEDFWENITCDFHIDLIKLMLALMKPTNFISNSIDCASEWPSGWNNEIEFKGRDQRLSWTNGAYQDTWCISIRKQTL